MDACDRHWYHWGRAVEVRHTGWFEALHEAQAFVFCHCPDERLDPWLCREFHWGVREKVSIPLLPWDEVDSDAARQTRLF